MKVKHTLLLTALSVALAACGSGGGSGNSNNTSTPVNKTKTEKVEHKKDKLVVTGVSFAGNDTFLFTY